MHRDAPAMRVFLVGLATSCVSPPPGLTAPPAEHQPPLPAVSAPSPAVSEPPENPEAASDTNAGDGGATPASRGPWHVIAAADISAQFTRFPLTDGALWVVGRWATPWLGLYDVEVALETDRGLVSIPDFTAGLPPLVQVNLLREPDGLWWASRWNSPTYYQRCFPSRWLNGWRVLSGLYGSYPNGLWATVNRYHEHESLVSSVYRRLGDKWVLKKAYRALGDQVVNAIPWKGGLLTAVQGYGRRTRFDLVGAPGSPPRFDAPPFSLAALFADPAGSLFAIVCPDDCWLTVWPSGASNALKIDLPTLRRGMMAPEVRFIGDGRLTVSGPPRTESAPFWREQGAKQTQIVVKLEGSSLTIVEETELAAVPPSLPSGFAPGQLQTATDGTWFVAGRPSVDGVMAAAVVSERQLVEVWRPVLRSSGQDLPIDRRCENMGALP